MWRVVRPQDFDGVWIEGDYDRRAARFIGMLRGRGDNGLVSQMNAVENTDGEEKRAGECGELRDGTENFHENDE
jgi:hypothetical protein